MALEDELLDRKLFTPHVAMSDSMVHGLTCRDNIERRRSQNAPKECSKGMLYNVPDTRGFGVGATNRSWSRRCNRSVEPSTGKRWECTFEVVGLGAAGEVAESNT